jgi:ribosomal protein S18 acetylase RimI-like enzyme
LTGLAIQPITADHHLDFFTSGVCSLDRWLVKEALNAHRGGLSSTHVSVDPEDEDAQVKGFFTICPTVVLDKVPGSKGGRQDGYPSYTLCKLARHSDLAGSGHGEELIGTAMVFVATAADLAGGRFLVVDPNVEDLSASKAEALREFYRTYGFEDLPESNRMYVTIKTIRDMTSTQT